MIEEVQDTLSSILTSNMAAELATLDDPAGGLAMTLTAPTRYLIDYDPDIGSMLPADLYPLGIIYYEDSTVDDELSTGYRVVWWHRFLVVCMFMTTDLTSYTDVLNAIENMQRGRSRYAEAVIGALKKNQQTSPIQMIRIERVDRSRTLVKPDMTQILGGIGIEILVRESQTL